MDAERIIEVLNEARARELAVIIQYMEHHYVAGGAAGLPSGLRQTAGDLWVSARGTGVAGRLIRPPDPVVSLKSIAKVEMLHAQSLANRIAAMGGVPTVTPGERCRASSLREMLELDLAAEVEAVALYTADIEVCRQEGDAESVALFGRILADEIAHASTFERLSAALA